MSLVQSAFMSHMDKVFNTQTLNLNAENGLFLTKYWHTMEFPLKWNTFTNSHLYFGKKKSNKKIRREQGGTILISRFKFFVFNAVNNHFDCHVNSKQGRAATITEAAAERINILAVLLFKHSAWLKLMTINLSSAMLKKIAVVSSLISHSEPSQQFFFFQGHSEVLVNSHEHNP